MVEPLNLKNLNQPQDELKKDEVLFTWKAALSKEIDKKWYFGLLSFCLLLIIIAVWRRNYVGAVCLLIIGSLIYILSNREEEEKNFIIQQNGIQVGNELFRFEKLDSFCFFDDPLELCIKRKNNSGGNIIFPIRSREDLYKIRSVLLKFLPEKEIELGFMDILRRKIRI